MGYNAMKKHIIPRQPTNRYERKRIPLWTAHKIHRDGRNMGSMNKKQKWLREDGIENLGDIWKLGLHQWVDLPTKPPKNCREAYQKVLSNINIGEVGVRRSKDIVKIYVSQGRVMEGSIIWEFKIYREDLATTYRMGQVVKEPFKSFRFAQGILTVELDILPPQSDKHVARVMAGLPKKKEGSGRQLVFVGHVQDKIAISEAFAWRDGSGLFQTETNHLHFL